MLFNRARAIDYMHEYGLDVLVATSPVNITYFTDYYCWIDPLFKEFMMVPGASSNLAQAYAVFPLEGEPALVVNPLFAANAEELWVKDLHIFGSAGLDDSLPAGDLPQSLHRFQELLLTPHDNATPTDALLSILSQRYGDDQAGNHKGHRLPLAQIAPQRQFHHSQSPVTSRTGWWGWRPLLTDR